MNILKYLSYISLAVMFQASSCADTTEKNGETPNVKPIDTDVEAYTTTANKSMLFKQVAIKFDTKPNMSPNTVRLDPSVRYQQMDGFGVAMTGSTCYNLLKMAKEDREKTLREAFDPKTGMGYSYIRISIGCSDFSMDEYTYCDQKGIENFKIHELDKRDLFPILREILAINPNVKIMGSPWTPPKWMKVNNLNDLKPFDSWTSGQLNPSYYQDYATYFVKYIQEMKSAGFAIESITIQNEPLNRGNSASMFMTWQEQSEFIKSALGPKFKEAGINTKIIIYDHNYDYDVSKEECKDQVDYPKNILKDPEAAKYIHGSAWHAYSGETSELNDIYAANPDKGIFFTEMSIGEWNYSFDGDLMWCMKEVGLGTINRNCKSVIVWNFMLDEKNGPNRAGGCNTCYGAVTVNTSNYSYAGLERKSHFYVIGHLSKVISQGAVRIGTSGFNKNGIIYSAFENPDGTYSMIIQNDNAENQKLTVALGKKSYSNEFPAKSVTSLRWKN